MPPFSFLSNHGLVLLCLAEEPMSRLRDIAAHLDITERTAQRIVSELVGAGYVSRKREGRRNVYSVRQAERVHLSAQRDVDLGSLLEVLAPNGARSSVARPAPA